MGCTLYILAGVWRKRHGWQGTVYLHQRGAFSVARFDNPGNAKALIAWNERQDWLHVFICIHGKANVINRRQGAVG